MPLLRNIGCLAQCRPDGSQDDIHVIANAALVWSDDRIVWVGPEADLPEPFRAWPAADAGGRLVVPGLVDCHTHLAFGGWRSEEFEQRIRGTSYQEIAERGGGILSTVARTRGLNQAALLFRCRDFLSGMAALGVTTVECKTGYGLEPATELRVLEVYAELAREGPQRIAATLLAAHTIPPEYRGRREAYVALVTDTIIPAAAGMARFCDVFVEAGAFTIEEARRIFGAGQRAGMVPKVHADQLSAGGGAELAADVGAASADHLEHITDQGIRALSAAGVVAVSLPIASLYLSQPPTPARRLLDAGVPVAVATDFNPGSAPSYHLPLAMTLACTLQRMTPAEVLKGATIAAARALRLEAECGSLEPGKSADFAIIDSPDVNHWLYHFRANACVRTVVRGRTVWG